MFKHFIFAFSLIVIFLGCSESQTAPEEKQTKEVYTVNYPLYYFTKRMAPEGVGVFFPVPKDVDPAFWVPTTQETLAFVKADLIILNGADYAKWTQKVSLPSSKLVNSSKAFEKELLYIESSNHSHGPKGEHSHTGTAFTTWLDMQQAIKQAESIKNALLLMEPKEKEHIEQSFLKLKHELEELDKGFKNAFSNPHRPIIASHPIYQYFARAYGLNLKALLWEPEMKIDAKAQDEINDLLAGHPAKVMIWEGKTTAENLDYIQSLGLQNIVIEPCMNRPENGDFMTQMKENLKNLHKK